ncbi:Gfo/Idh/MocA family oxidoreductase [Elusimicrobiota bacterium]
MPDSLRVGVVGTGHLGRHHARIYSELGNARLVAVSDIDEKKGGKIAEKYGCRYCKDFHELLDSIDAVSIVTPTETHYEIAREFLKHNISTLIEKPITSSIEQASKLIMISEENSCILQVGHIERFNAAIKKAREYIKEPRFIEVNRLSRFPDRSLDIGVVLDLMIHDIDIILSFVDSSVKSISSIGASVFSDKEDIANCRLAFENGCIANITASRISYKSERKFRVFQSDSYISLDYEKQDFVIYKKKKNIVDKPSDIERIVPQLMKSEPLREELMDFLSTVTEGKTPTVSGYHGYNAIKLARDIINQI